ncbi:outer membrane protein [Chelatococcus sp. YT9]|uniref:outer membrane protein n=1 Tax=Chelatococcus sp. YT9 TaxID=2835635 RepID=UPI001BCE3E87|nr:outer membrane protein [Chelatococcus sp. YT9]MBS7697781.1 porin family protein [Chelatococcus sp. YT9]
MHKSSCSVALSLLLACGLAGQVMAADLPSRMSTPVAPAPVVVVLPAFTWTGFYAGINGGYSRLALKKHDAGEKDTSANDWAFGAQAGYNYQLGSWVIGAEADFDKQTGKVTGRNAFGPSLTLEDKYGATIRGRFGYAIDRVLIYGTGGLALRQLGVALAPSKPVSHWHSGFAVGGGVEYAMMDNVSVKAEYLYTKVSKKTYVLPDGQTASTDAKGGQVRLGLNYKF